MLLVFRTMNSSESGRKINQAVNITSKAVGGAISQAKGTFSNLWSAFTASSVQTAPVPPITPTRTSYVETKTSVTKTIEIEKIEFESTEEDETININIENNLKNLENIRRNSKDSPELKGNGLESQSHVESSGIVEIGREAEILDTNRQNDRVFTV